MKVDEESIKIAQKYHFMLLTKLVIEKPNPSFHEKEETFRAYEEMCRTITAGDLEADKLDFLKSLPIFEAWVNEEVYDKICASPFYLNESKPAIDIPESVDTDITKLEEMYIKSFPEKSQEEAKDTLSKLKSLMDTERYVKFITNEKKS